MRALRLLEDLHCQGPQKMRALADELGLTPRNIVPTLSTHWRAKDSVRRTAHLRQIGVRRSSS